MALPSQPPADAPVPLDVPSVKSAERTVRILETLAASPTKLTLAELQERMGYPRSSLHALVRTLRELKWIEADTTGSAFGVGPHALLSGTAYLDRDPALPYAYAALEDLRSEVGYTTHYARRDGASSPIVEAPAWLASSMRPPRCIVSRVRPISSSAARSGSSAQRLMGSSWG